MLKEGFNSEVFSMDKLPSNKEGHPHTYLRQAILENRISYYHHPHMLAEVINLQRLMLPTTTAQNPKMRWKVDHPPQMLDLDGNKVRGSKDVADALGGVVRHCMVLDPASMREIPPMKGIPPEGKRSQGALPPKPAFVGDDDWLFDGDDYDVRGRVQGFQQ